MLRNVLTPNRLLTVASRDSLIRVSILGVCRLRRHFRCYARRSRVDHMATTTTEGRTHGRTDARRERGTRRTQVDEWSGEIEGGGGGGEGRGRAGRRRRIGVRGGLTTRKNCFSPEKLIARQVYDGDGQRTLAPTPSSSAFRRFGLRWRVGRGGYRARGWAKYLRNKRRKTPSRFVHPTVHLLLRLTSPV